MDSVHNMSWLYWYTKCKQYRDPRHVVGSAIARIDPAAADVYKLKVAAYPDDVAKYINYTISNNLMTVDDWARVFNVSGADPDFLASVLNSQYIPASNAAAILSSQYTLLSRAVAIVNSPNLSASKATDILKDAKISANTVQSILYNIPFSDRLIDILTATAPDVTLNANATFRGVNIFRTLNLNGYTYIADGQPHVIIAKQIYIPATSKLIKTPTGGAGGANGGGAGGGGLIIFANMLNNYGSISADGQKSQGYYLYGGGQAGGAGVFGLLSGDSYTARGGPGGVGTDRGGATGGGGPRGASYTNACTSGAGGGISTVTYTATSLLDTIRKALIDRFIVNVLGKSPSSTTTIPSFYGAGGGGGCSVGDGWFYHCGAGGGASGGEVVIFSITINNAGVISALGGAGALSYSSLSGTRVYQSPAGAGGVIYVFYKTLQSLGTLDVSGNESGLAKAVAV
jgi:hypothetical protein